MALRTGSISTRVALGCLAIALSGVANAQFGGGRGGGAQAYTPPEDGKDAKSVLFNWPWHMGMLRGIEEHELVVTLEYRAEGTVQVNGQPCTITAFANSRCSGRSRGS
jgi:hypothetical protein